MDFTLNNRPVAVPEDEGDEPLLFVLRDRFGLNGPRFGCGVGSCGACTVVVDGQAQRACTLPVAAIAGRAVVTLEGIATDGGLHPLQQAWIAERVPQCGYCQNGQIMTAYAQLSAQPDADAAQVAQAMDEVLCRCGTQMRIRRAIASAQRALGQAR